MRGVHGADSDPEEEIVDGELVDGLGDDLVGELAAREWTSAQGAGQPRALPVDDRFGQSLDWARTPAVQSAVAAATGFVAGAATLALARRYGKARLERALAAASGEPALAAGAQRGPGRTYIVHVRPLPTIGPGASGE